MVGDFEVFDGRHKYMTRGGARVSIHGAYLMYISADASRMIGVPDYVLLLFDPITSTVAIEPATEDDERAFVVSHNPQSDAGYVSARSFGRHYGIQRGTSYPCQLQDGRLVFTVDRAQEDQSDG